MKLTIKPSDIYDSKAQVFNFLTARELVLTGFNLLKNAPNDCDLYLTLQNGHAKTTEPSHIGPQASPRLFVTPYAAPETQNTVWKGPWKLTAEERAMQPDLAPLPGEIFYNETPESLTQYLKEHNLSLLAFRKPQKSDLLLPVDGCPNGRICGFCDYRDYYVTPAFIVTRHKAYDPDPQGIWE